VEQDFYSEYYELEDRHWWFVGRRRIFLALLDDLVGGRRDLDLLDFGCGTGTMAGHLARYGTVEAVDADADAVAFCRRRGLARVQQLTGDGLPFEDGRFDVVTTFDVLEHIEDDLSALTELHRVLRPGGVLVAAVPAFPFLWGPQDVISHHYRRYVRPELRARLEDAGFAVRRASYFNSLLFPAVAAIRIVRRAFPEPEELRSDFGVGPARLNRALAAAFGGEAALVRRRDLPFGVSLLAVAERTTPSA
jgi:SAM-dependent methyltransferase